MRWPNSKPNPTATAARAIQLLSDPILGVEDQIVDDLSQLPPTSAQREAFIAQVNLQLNPLSLKPVAKVGLLAPYEVTDVEPLPPLTGKAQRWSEMSELFSQSSDSLTDIFDELTNARVDVGSPQSGRKAFTR